MPEDVLEYKTPKYFWKWLQSSDDEFWMAVGSDVLGFVATDGAVLVKLYVLSKIRGTGIAQTLLSHGEIKFKTMAFLKLRFSAWQAILALKFLYTGRMVSQWNVSGSTLVNCINSSLVNVRTH